MKTQAEMRAHFLPILEASGQAVQRAGRGLARPARQGEEVLTVVNGEVVARAEVVDTTSMVLQESSSDREHYVVDGERFAQLYDPTPIPILDAGMEFDALRNRGYKYYVRRKTVQMLYRVTQEDIDFVNGMFQVPFSSIPMPLRLGDCLSADFPHADVIYVMRNAEQLTTAPPIEVHYVYASPLIQQNGVPIPSIKDTIETME